MFLLTRPPVLRWVAAVALVIVALWADLRPPATVEHPFARTDIDIGSEVTAADVDWIAVPPEVFEPVDLPITVARPVEAGDPILASLATADTVSPPDGWLLVELAVPQGAHPGSQIVVVISDFGSEVPVSVEGVVVTTGVEDGFGTTLASCAFPADEAGLVAVAAAENRISVLSGS